MEFPMLQNARNISNEIQSLIARLEQIAARARALDLEARRQLHEAKDQEKYREILLEKTELLVSLPELTRSGAKALQVERRIDFERAICELAEDAMQAMAVGSVFYMSVLLLPGDERPESPNDLEKLIAWLRG